MSETFHIIDFDQQPETEIVQPSITKRRQTTFKSFPNQPSNSVMAEALFSKADENRLQPEVVVGGVDDRIRIFNTQENPFSFICALDLHFPEHVSAIPFVGTGALISPNVVLTCAHNIYDHQSKTAIHRITAAPGQAGLNQKPFGIIDAARAFVPQEFMQSETSRLEFDYAALILREPVGNDTGHFGIIEASIADLVEHNIHLTGFPALANFEFGTGKAMLHHAAPFRNLEGGVISHFADASGGNSGSPLYFYEHDNQDLEPRVVGVHSGGLDNGAYNHGVALAGSVFDHVEQWIAAGEAFLAEQDSN